MNVPEVPWRFSERYLATDFVQAKNVAILEKANSFYSTDNDTFVKEVAEYIRDEFYYPLDNAGNPAASGQLLRHQKGFMSYHFKNCVYYAWGLPNEILDATLCGICIDTANLATSLFRAKENPDTWVVLGDVLAVDGDRLLGRHAWTTVPNKGNICVLETTIHDEGVNNLIAASEVYNKDSDWAQKNGIYYSVQAKYNESEFVGEGPLGVNMVWLMGLPAKRVLLFGAESVWRQLEQKPKAMIKEWRQEVLLINKLLNEAYRGA